MVYPPTGWYAEGMQLGRGAGLAGWGLGCFFHCMFGLTANDTNFACCSSVFSLTVVCNGHFNVIELPLSKN